MVLPPPPPPPPPPVGHEGVFAAPPKPGVLDATLSSVQQGALGAAASLYNKVGSARDTAKSRAKAVTPEERRAWSERGVAGLTLAASVGQVVGGRKVKAASSVTSAAIGCCGPASAAPAASAGTAASAAPASSVGVEVEAVLVEVVATEDAGGSMLVVVDGREYRVVVPAGVARGQAFRFDVPTVAVLVAVGSSM